MEQWAQSQGQPAFRGRQLHDWIYAKGARSLEAITVLPKAWREALLGGQTPGQGQSQGASIGRLPLLHRSDARDGTTKLLLGTADGLSLETVGIPSDDRLTVCVSSQVGCPMACRFCATGKDGLQRSLAVHEIVDQVLSIREAMDRRPSHVVFMGMGEPLLNIEAVLAAID
ncbi:MAG: radical SAM protein, partial [Synechococcaceae cyanobacterium ELA182]